MASLTPAEKSPKKRQRLQQQATTPAASEIHADDAPAASVARLLRSRRQIYVPRDELAEYVIRLVKMIFDDERDAATNMLDTHLAQRLGDTYDICAQLIAEKHELQRQIEVLREQMASHSPAVPVAAAAAGGTSESQLRPATPVSV